MQLYLYHIKRKSIKPRSGFHFAGTAEVQEIFSPFTVLNLQTQVLSPVIRFSSLVNNDGQADWS